MKSFIILIAVFSIILTPELSEAYQVTCSRDMKESYQRLIQLPEARQIVSNALKRGPIHVESSDDRTDGFEGMWDAGRRAVVISGKANQTTGQKINTMMMEFHNAQSDQQLCQLFKGAQKGRLTKEYYVEQVERVEHQNAVSSARLLAKGIHDSVYPSDAAWDVIEDFDDHYKVQQILEHSLWIARNFDQLNRHGPRESYKGTVPGLYQLTENEKFLLCRYLHLKSDMKSHQREVRERAQERFSRELSRQRRGGQGACCEASDTQTKCFDTVFGS